MGYVFPFGNQQRRRQLGLNQFNGIQAENRNIALNTMFKDLKVEREHKGSDFKVTKFSNILSPKGIKNVEGEWFEEVKNGNAKLSKRQKELQKEKGERGFKVKRFNF